MKKIQIINGPNLNLLGKREPSVYGSSSFEDYLDTLRKSFPMFEITFFQSNIEGELLNKIHEIGFDYDGIILNAGAYTHTSIALYDAIRAVKLITSKMADAVIEANQGEEVYTEEAAAQGEASDIEEVAAAEEA